MSEIRRPKNPDVKPYRDYEIASEYPFFLKDIDYLPIYDIDPGPRA